jgi:hypothetical protein
MSLDWSLPRDAIAVGKECRGVTAEGSRCMGEGAPQSSGGWLAGERRNHRLVREQEDEEVVESSGRSPQITLTKDSHAMDLAHTKRIGRASLLRLMWRKEWRGSSTVFHINKFLYSELLKLGAPIVNSKCCYVGLTKRRKLIDHPFEKVLNLISECKTLMPILISLSLQLKFLHAFLLLI